MKLKNFIGMLVLSLVLLIPASVFAMQTTTYNVDVEASVVLDTINKTHDLTYALNGASLENATEEEFNQLREDIDNFNNNGVMSVGGFFSNVANLLIPEFERYPIGENDNVEIELVEKDSTDTVKNYTLSIVATKHMNITQAATKTLNLELLNGNKKTYTVTEDDYSDYSNEGVLLMYVLFDYDYYNQLMDGHLMVASSPTYYYKIENNRFVRCSADEALIRIYAENAESDNMVFSVELVREVNTLERANLIYSNALFPRSLDTVIPYIGYSPYSAPYEMSNVNINFTYGTSASYEVIEGNEQTYIANANGELTFRIDADYSKFENDGKVYVDDVLVDSKFYTSKSGSTIITFSKEFTSTLSNGSHNLRVEFSDGVANTTFTIDRNSNINNPATLDDISISFITLIISSIGLLILFFKKNLSKARV